MKTKSILVADDDRSMRKALAFELTDLGYAVTEAQDGGEAIRLIRNEPFDLVICDLIMPKATGLEVYEAVLAARHQPKFISMSAFTESHEAIIAENRFKSNFLRKPFPLDTLLHKVRKLLENEQTLRR